MTFTEAIRTCFRKYATFSGRARRPEYWWFALFVFAGAFALTMLDGAVFGFGTEEAPRPRIFAPVFQLAAFLPLLAAGWRRMHDTGRPGWLVLLPVAISLGGFLLSLMGVIGFARLERIEAVDEAQLRDTALLMGSAGFIVVVVAQVVATALLVWWLTRPTEPEENAYGPVPERHP